MGLDSEIPERLIRWFLGAQGALRTGAALTPSPAAKVTPPGREAPGSESDSRVRGQMGSWRRCWLSHGELPDHRKQGYRATGTLGSSPATAHRRLDNTWSDRVYTCRRRKGGRPPQEADEADRAELGRGHERPALEDGPPRAGGESLGPGAAIPPPAPAQRGGGGDQGLGGRI